MNKTSRVRSIGRFTLCLSLPVIVWLATASLMSYEPSSGGIDLQAGSGKFRDYCGACHIIEPGITTHHGPNLSEIGKVAATRQPGKSAPEYILESILDPAAFVAPENHQGMPKNLAVDLSPDEIRNIVAFLANRGASANYDEILRLEIPDLRRDPSDRVPIRQEQMAFAERVLREKGTCLQCHTLHRNAEYQVFAPALFAVGLSDGELVRESIVNPHKVVPDNYKSVQVLLIDGNVLSGKLISRTDDGLVLLARDAANANQVVRHEIPLSEVEEEDGELVIQETQESPMPTGFDQLLTKEELDAIVTMIQQLN